ncbi:MAG TPA: pyrroloquinoline quinone biosynthesis protein PqqE [Candidatus Acidoferrum sp.]|nr:pyrroloquinoline quinone biosynthesis protein PqqE [Candidatus Acidoferrum sp.]
MPNTVQNPLALVAELTHRCPLHCVYCSNPLELQARSSELSTETWSRVFKEAAEAGVLQADFTGGEPLARPDIVELIRSARAAGLYVSLITSGLPLDEVKLDLLVDAGLDHFQLSFQGAREETANDISGTKSHQHKLRVLEWVKRYRIGLTLNFVIHRQNIDELEEMLVIVKGSGAGCVEFASVQYYGWAFANRERLLPTRQQLDRCVERLKRAEEELQGRTRIVFVVPDYYAKYPKPCVGGWGRKLLLVTPHGEVLPCHAAPVIPGLKFENVKNRSLREIWECSEAFQKFRREDWMQEPCKSCDRRAQDFGGCRCQAMLLTADATATDPVCSLAPQRPKVDAILRQINDHGAQGTGSAAAPITIQSDKIQWLYRPNPS